jgi:hypothetical protein
MQDNTWIAIADGSGAAGTGGNRINQVLPSPVPNSGLSGEGPSGIASAWCGASTDQRRGEVMLVAGGGHADYPGNEGYALALRDSRPGWRRISEPTPQARLTQLTVTNGVMTYSDGRPRADHNSGWPVWGDGRIWFGAQSAATSGNGDAGSGAYSYNRDALGTALTPMPHTDNGGAINPWQIHGQVPGMELAQSNGAYTFGSACFDRYTHQYWAFAGFGWDRTTPFYWRVKTIGPTLGARQAFQANNGNPFFNCGWAVSLYDLGGYILLCDVANQRMILFDPRLEGQLSAFTVVSNISGTFRLNTKCSAHYIARNNTIAVIDPSAYGREINRIAVPTTVTNGRKVLNPSGTWAGSILSPSGPSFTLPADAGKTYTRIQLVEDMGDGRSALVYVPRIDAPTYVYKIPAGGL